MALPKVILDCDPGHDDAMAILMANRHTDLLGITTVSGNVSLESTTRNALLTCQLADIDAPVHSGADRPLVAAPKHAPEIHGKSGLDGAELPELEREVTSTQAVRFIVDTVRTTDDVWLVAIGPLTNLALALREAPDIAGRLAGISLMGGSAGPGNMTPTAEFNIWCDPEAAAIVFESGVPIKMCGLNLSWKFMLNDDSIAALRDLGNRMGEFSADILEFYIGANEARSGRREAPLHDPCALMALTHPELFEAKARHVSIEVDGRYTVGMTVVDERDFLVGEPPNAKVMYNINRDVAMDLFIDTVGTYC